MQLLYIYEPAGKSSGLPAAKTITGKQFALHELRDESGAWFPKEALVNNAEVHAFSAGLWNEAPREADATHFPDGCWLALHFDRNSDTLMVRSDPFLQTRWYYTELDGKLYLSNSLLFLHSHLPDRPEIDWTLSHEMLRFGYLPGKHTPLKNVYSLRSGETLICRNGKLSIERAEIVPPQRNERAISSEEIRDSLTESVRNAIGDFKHIVVPISGGMDSRIILGIALEMLPRESIHTLTFGHTNSLDFQIGRRVARELGVANTALPMDTRPLELQAEENFYVGEGIYWSIPEYPVQPLGDSLPAKSLVISGYIGDVIFGSYDPEHELTNFQASQSLLYQTTEVVQDSLVAKLLSSSQKTGFRNVSGSGNVSPLHGYEAFIFDSHQMNRTNFSLFVHRSKVCYATPFVSANVLDVAYALSANERRDEKAFFSMVRKYYPKLWSMPLKSSFGYPPEFLDSRRTVLLRAWRKFLSDADATLGPMLGTILYRHPRLNYSHPREWITPPHREYVVACIERLMKQPVFVQAELRKLLDTVSAGKAIPQNVLKGLVTLAQWDKHYGTGE